MNIFPESFRFNEQKTTTMKQQLIYVQQFSNSIKLHSSWKHVAQTFMVHFCFLQFFKGPNKIEIIKV